MEFTDVALWIAGIAIAMTLYKMLFNPGAAASKNLHRNMRSMGTIAGRTYDEIVRIAGKPTLIETSGDVIKCSWNTQNYAIKLEFGKDRICTGVIGEAQSS